MNKITKAGIKLSREFIVALKRKRGEQDLTIEGMARETGLSRFTLDALFKNANNGNVKPKTKKALEKWLNKTEDTWN